MKININCAWRTTLFVLAIALDRLTDAGRIVIEGSGGLDDVDDYFDKAPNYTGLLKILMRNGHKPLKLTSSFSVEFQTKQKGKTFYGDDDFDFGIHWPPADLEFPFFPPDKLIGIDVTSAAPTSLNAPAPLKAPESRILLPVRVCPLLAPQTKSPTWAKMKAHPNGPSWRLYLPRIIVEGCDSNTAPQTPNVQCRMEMKAYYHYIYILEAEIVPNGLHIKNNECYCNPPTKCICKTWIMLESHCTAFIM